MINSKPIYKISRYIVPTTIGNKTIIFSTRTGKLTRLSQELWLSLTTSQIHLLPEKIKTHLEELKIIIPTETDEFETIVAENNRLNNSDTLYEVIQPSADCQMGCFYCGQNHENKKIDPDTIDKIINTIASKITNGTYKRLHIGWFGGEPLIGLNQIRSITKRLKQICAENNLEYTAKIVTNGLLLSLATYKELCDELHISLIEITLDGIATDHNKRRNLKVGTKGTFEKILKNLKKITEIESRLKATINIRCNVDRENKNSVIPLIDSLYAEGILQKINFYTAKIHEWGEKDNKENLEGFDYAKEEVAWITHLIERKHINSLLPKRNYNTCMATNSATYVYDAYGNVFNCTEVSYTKNFSESEFYLGSIEAPNTELKTDYKNKWLTEIRNKKTLCYDCNLYPVCGGSCPKSWGEGNIPCPSFKYNLTTKIKMHYLLKYGTNA
ncbi:MAG TPA: radical SAM protein [Flavobacterium sp.]|uniref:radical SAM/SPASM domain-containing protein n=1 Tax=Flavobacterium sp. TaxID=239 RepID=UPI002D05ACA4|nr:radical SAM protein [Flavobacterium sp.]HSD13890.1 radical SAM protein [Flavobacterium sp.]